MDRALKEGLRPGDSCWPHTYEPRERCIYMYSDPLPHCAIRVAIKLLEVADLVVDEDHPRQAPQAFGDEYVQAVRREDAPTAVPANDEDERRCPAGAWADQTNADSTANVLTSLCFGSVAIREGVLAAALSINPVADLDAVPSDYHDQLLCEASRQALVRSAYQSARSRKAERRERFKEAVRLGLRSNEAGRAC